MSDLREELVSTALEWESAFGVMPAITSAVSEFDAAMLVGHTPESYSLDMRGSTAVTRGLDFKHNGVRYQIKANRPSGKPGSKVTLVGKANNYDWDKLIWVHYNERFEMQEAWLWDVADYKSAFDGMARIGPSHMREGKQIFATDPPHPGHGAPPRLTSRRQLHSHELGGHAVRAIHLLNRFEGGKPANMHRYGDSAYSSGFWDFSEDFAKQLRGQWVYFHETKGAVSYFGGVVTGYRLVKKPDFARPDRVELIFEPREKASGCSWRGKKHAMAWNGGIVPADLPHEESAGLST